MTTGTAAVFQLAMTLGFGLALGAAFVVIPALLFYRKFYM